MYTDKELLFLQYLYYHNPFTPRNINIVDDKHANYSLYVSAKLNEGSFSIHWQKKVLNKLLDLGLVACKGDSYELLPLGEHVAYNLAEYNIQRLNGYWKFLKPYLSVSGNNVLDIGCSGGTSFVAAMEAGLFEGWECHGIDYDQSSIDSGHHIFSAIWPDYPNVHLHQGDARNLPFEPGSMDVVHSKGTMHYLPPDAFLTEVCRVLRPGGVFAVITPSWKTMGRRAVEFAKNKKPRSAAKNALSLANTLLDFAGWGIYKGGLFSAASLTGYSRLLKKSGASLLFLDYLPLAFSHRPVLAVGVKKD